MKILVADDSRVMRQIVIRTLRQAGFSGHDIVEAEDGADGFAKVQTEKPDLVLSDWNMPNKTGIDFLRDLRGSGNQTPFGFVTSEGSEEMRTIADQAGALFLIAKPFTPEPSRRPSPQSAYRHRRRPPRDGLPAGDKEIRDLLGDLLDKGVDFVRPGPPFAITDRNPASVAVYVDDSLLIQAMICFDLALSAYAGAALGAGPRDPRRAGRRGRNLPAQITETLHEVLNIARGAVQRRRRAAH